MEVKKAKENCIQGRCAKIGDNITRGKGGHNDKIVHRILQP